MHSIKKTFTSATLVKCKSFYEPLIFVYCLTLFLNMSLITVLSTLCIWLVYRPFFITFSLVFLLKICLSSILRRLLIYRRIFGFLEFTTGFTFLLSIACFEFTSLLKITFFEVKAFHSVFCGTFLFQSH